MARGSFGTYETDLAGAREPFEDCRKEAYASPLLPEISPLRFLFLIALITIPFIGSSDFTTRGEAREALVVQSMLADDEWTLPRGYGGAVPSKPPLLHWCAAVISVLLGGMSEFSLRLPSVLSGLGAAMLFVTALRRHVPRRTLLLFASVLTLSFEWFRASVVMRVDMVHSAALAGGLLACFLASQGGAAAWWLAGSLLFACAALAKGPVGLVLPGLILSLWAVLDHRKRAGLPRALGTVLGVVVGSGIIASCWYVAAYLRAPDEFTDKVWFENVTRFAGSTSTDVPHNHSAFYLLGTLVLGTLPWSPLAAWASYRSLPRTFEELSTLWSSASPLVRFSCVCVVSIVAFYCIPTSKRGVYVLSAYPFLALLAALLFEHAPRVRGITVVVLQLAFFVYFVAMSVILPLVVSPKNTERSLGNFVRSAFENPRRAFSFGFEFYGAAYYSGIPFERIEETFASEPPPPPSGSPVLVPADEEERLDELLTARNLASRSVAELPVGGRSIRILELLSPQRSPSEFTPRRKGTQERYDY